MEYKPKASELQAAGAFDAYLKAIPAGEHDIQLPPGRFLTEGQPDGASADTPTMWSPKSGWRLRGTGARASDVTIALAAGSLRDGKKWHVIGADYAPVLGVSIENLTLDCGYSLSPIRAVNFSGLVLRGSNNTLRGVRAVNWGSRLAKSECFGLGLVASGTDAHNNLIEDCEVCEPGGPDAVAGWTAILQSAIPPARTFHATIRHCRASNKGGTDAIYSNGFTIYNAVNGVIERSQAQDLWSGVFLDDAGGEDLLIRDCQLDEVRRGLFVSFTREGNVQGSLVARGNRVRLIDPGTTPSVKGFEVNSFDLKPGGFGSVILENNYVQAAGLASHLALVRGAERLLVSGNVFFAERRPLALGGRANGQLCQWANWYGDGTAIVYEAEKEAARAAR